ncbi:MAG: tetratricopeptide repeat protein [Cyanobacteriota bacterium]|nr:tetratricopeptide repeat protein [Cyanobacteriota bacterium]
MSANQLLKQANQLKRAGRLDEAIALYHQVIEINPNFAWVYNNLGDVLVKQGRLDEAIVYYRQSLEIIPNSPSVHYSLGNVCWKTGDLEAATQYLEKAINLKPDFCKLYQLLAQVLTQKGEFDQATIAYSKVAQLNPGLSQFQTTLGLLSQELVKSKIDVNNAQKTLKINNSASQLGLTSLNNSTMHLLHQKLWNLLAQKKDPVLVLGMHNSGTSILAEILHKSGLFLGANMDHYESYFFSIFINNNLIMGGGSNWAQVPIMSIDKVKAFSDKVRSYIKHFWILDYLRCGYNGESAWGFKDPRLCVLLPLYLEIFPDSKVVHIKRNSNDIAASLCKKKKLAVGQIDNFDYWKTLTLQHVERVLEYANCCGAYYELNYENLCLDSEKTVLQLFDFLGLRFTDQTKDLLKKIHSSRIGSYQSISR